MTDAVHNLAHRRRQRSRDAGFTLLELTLAMGIMMFIGIGLLVFYQYTVQSRDQVLTELERITASRMLMDRLTAELRAVAAAPNLPPAIQGGSGRIQLLTTVLPEPGAWQADELGQTLKTSDLRHVSYELGGLPAGSGGGYGLRRIERPHHREAVVDLSREQRVTALTDQIRFMHLRYYDGATWQESWTGNILPRGIEVTLGAEPLPEDVEPADYPHRIFRRVIALPGASRSVATAQGLGDRGALP